MTTEPTEPRQATEPAPARDHWDTTVPRDRAVAGDSATLPDQVGDDFALREAGADETLTDYQTPPLREDGVGYARREETGTTAPNTESSGRPAHQEGDSYARQESAE